VAERDFFKRVIQIPWRGSVIILAIEKTYIVQESYANLSKKLKLRNEMFSKKKLLAIIELLLHLVLQFHVTIFFFVKISSTEVQTVF
jgi:hypothetical protein